VFAGIANAAIKRPSFFPSGVRMEKELKEIHLHMRELGLAALAHANWHANYYSPDNAYWAELSVLQAAHAAEILVKARIAQEHPLLIFEHLPKADAQDKTRLGLQKLVEAGRTYQYGDLPDRLWATTGVEIPNLETFRAFGRLRNSIQHFAVPERSELDAVDFIYAVIDPFINSCWGLYAVDYNEDYEEHIYLLGGLIRAGVRFLISPDAARKWESVEKHWPKHDSAYQVEMELRLQRALAGPVGS
jgi:hypothetical protein